MEPLAPPDEWDRADALEVLIECYPPIAPLDQDLLDEAMRTLEDYAKLHKGPCLLTFSDSE